MNNLPPSRAPATADYRLNLTTMLRLTVLVRCELDDDTEPVELDVRHLGIGDPTALTFVLDGPPHAVAVLVGRLLHTQPANTPSDRHSSHRTVAAGWEQLTSRELVVAAMAGRGMTDQQIANRLHIATSTVNYHLRNIYRKLGIDSRVRLARLMPPDQDVGNADLQTPSSAAARTSPWDQDSVRSIDRAR